jgi:hydrogenase maturation protein HypF
MEPMAENSRATVARMRIRLNGIVQGVGFRPFVYRLARRLSLAGWVNNDSDGVCVEVEGKRENIRLFAQLVRQEAPPLARIVESHETEITPAGDTEFSIIASEGRQVASTFISPDVATCDECLVELFDPTDRRYRYPFLNCTNCGPRYSIVEGIPYDRPLTSMKIFPLCADCEREYRDPADRRFHAQPNACPVCGPQLSLYDNQRNRIDGDNPVAAAVSVLRQGKVLALRGVGGFHLAVDPFNSDAVALLRRRKGRAEKPFALMSSSLAEIEQWCHVCGQERALLEHFTRPIVLLRAKPGSGISGQVAPKNKYLGFMLAYSPLHHLLLRDNFAALVMTSGNLAEEPIAISNDEAFDRLKDLTDYLLIHDREILQRCDDSVVKVAAGRRQLIRRSRGFVPRAVRLEIPTTKRILACGGELKNTVALSRGESVFLSQHIGDLDNPAALAFFRHCARHLQELLEIKPDLIACDMHPEYLSTKWAHEQEEIQVLEIQHHHAHLVSAQADAGDMRPAVGIILDGTGYGTDGTIWGGEVLIGDAGGFDRFAWFEPVAMPGGTAAVRQPWRMALSYLNHAYGPSFAELEIPSVKAVTVESRKLIMQMLAQGINCPLTSSCGRLFDGVSALLGICPEISYDAQAAIEMEMAIDESDLRAQPYDSLITGQFTGGAIPIAALIRFVVKDIIEGQSVQTVAARFHASLAEMLLVAARSARAKSGIDRVVLSGGVFQNKILFELLIDRLQRDDFIVITHHQVPPNDGGLALGQVAIASAYIAGTKAGRKQ